MNEKLNIETNEERKHNTVKDDLGLANGIDFSKMPMGDNDMEQA